MKTSEFGANIGATKHLPVGASNCEKLNKRIDINDFFNSFNVQRDQRMYTTDHYKGTDGRTLISNLFKSSHPSLSDLTD